MDNIHWFDQIKPSDRLLVGDKALALSQLLQHGYPVIPGFAIGASTMRKFLRTFSNSESLLSDLPESSLSVDVDNYKGLQLVAQKSRQEIMNATLPSEDLSNLVNAAQKLNSPTLILRSSLPLPDSLKHTFGGLLPSQVCLCDRLGLEIALKKVWAELFSAKSIFYWQRAGIGVEELNLAILVQPISNAVASGTISIDADRINIRATWGLGHSIVKGEVLPDFYQIQRGTATLITRQLGSQTRAYRLKTERESTSADLDCLEAYSLDRAEQEQYVLDETYLNRLIELVEHLIPQREYIGSLEWTLFKKSEDLEPQLYLTQSDLYIEQPTQISFLATKASLMKDSQPLLTGLAASPGEAIALTQVISGRDRHVQAIPQGRIIVTTTITPDWLPLLKKSAGVVVEQGGVTSHAAIIAREIGIPAVVGAAGATRLLKTGESIRLNGHNGEIYRHSQDGDRLSGAEVVFRHKGKEEFSNWRSPNPTYPIATQLLVNLSQPSSIASAAALPVDGVGLIRSELMLLDLLSSHPGDELMQASQRSVLLKYLTQSIIQFAAAFAPRPVFYRSTDWHSFELSSGSRSLEVNPNLIHRGTYNYLLDPTLFDLELDALAQVQASGYTNVNLILPFVRGVEEFNFCRHRVERAGLTRQESFQLWIMAEVPSVLFLLPKYVQAGVQGIAIGTNDLTDLLLGVNREQPEVMVKYNTRHPAIQEALKQLIQLAKTAGISCSICGQAPADYPEIIDNLVRWGINAISVEPKAVEKTYQAIARAEQRLILEAARDRVQH